MPLSAASGIERINEIIFTFDTTTLIPYVLYIEKNVSDTAIKNELYEALEAYIVRRVITRQTTKNYNRLFSGSLILNQVLSKDDFVKYMAESDDINNRMPTDKEVAEAFHKSVLVNKYAVGVLYLMESKMRNNLQATDLKGITHYSLEHLMPKKWRNNWKNMTEGYNAADRDAVLLTLGNLAIITQALNASVRDADWNGKKHGSKSNGGLLTHASGIVTLSEYLHYDDWNENSIYKRADDLLNKALEIWRSNQGALPEVGSTKTKENETTSKKDDTIIESAEPAHGGFDTVIDEPEALTEAVSNGSLSWQEYEFKIIKPDIFMHRYRQLLYATALAQGNTDIAFDRGVWFEQEGYKAAVRQGALDRLKPETWIDRKTDYNYILDCMYKAILVAMPDNSHAQNLMDYGNYHTFDTKIRKNIAKSKEYAGILYDIFHGDNDGANFDKLVTILKFYKVYDQIAFCSFIFFLKDDTKYVTARRDGMQKNIAKLGVNASCVTNCSWDNYRRYLELINEIKLIVSADYPNMTIVDAQSLLWSLWMTNEGTPELDPSTNLAN